MARFHFLIALVGALAVPTTGHGHVVELPKLLQNGFSQVNLSGETFSTVMFRVIIPAGARDLRFDTSGGSGDCDIFVRFGAQPTDNSFDAAGTGATTAEHLRFGSPAAGAWYVKIDAARAYPGVTLRAIYKRTAAAAAVPIFAPGPGSYAGIARIRMSTPLQSGVVRYTIDGTDPTALSPAYTIPFQVTADTELRAQTFAGTTPRGPVLVAPYFVAAADTVVPLQSGIPQRHRAGVAGSNTVFKITVPSGMRRLDVLTRGGAGRVAVILRNPAGDHVFRRVGVANRTDLAVPLPAAGEWFIELRGRSDFSGCTVQASYRSIKADLIVWPDALTPYESTETFAPEDCEVQEGMITTGTHRLLRFTTESRNIGGGHVVMGDPVGNPNFEFQECHGHYHFKGFAAYTLRDQNGAIVAAGKKVGFCLEDVSRWDPTSPAAARFDCEEQGIQAGWSDIYDGGLPGQWVDITGLPAGDYQLEITINPDGRIDEADYTNNTTSVPVKITGM